MEKLASKARFFLCSVACMTAPAFCQADEIDDAILRLAQGPRQLEAANELYDAEPPRLIPKLISAIQDGLFESDGGRVLAYQILVGAGGAQSERGLDQLLNGLNDPIVQAESARGLAGAPKAEHPRVAEVLGKLLVDRRTSPEALAAAIGTLAHFGEAADGQFERISVLFRAREHDESVRWSAAFAMLRIRGVHRAMPEFADLDPVGEAVLLRSLGRYGAETHGSFGLSNTERDGIRAYVLQRLTSFALEVRVAAVESIGGVYGNALFDEAPGGKRLNAQVQEALQRRAALETDADLRDRIKQFLDQSK